MINKTVFSGADILLPKFSGSGDCFEKWSVIACDQFTSNREYWKKVEEKTAGHPSSYNYILPEAYLEGEKAVSHSVVIAHNMEKNPADVFSVLNGFVYVERTLVSGKIRRGVVGKIDLEKYDYSRDSLSPVRASEETVTERLPPRAKIRSTATVELPHILVFVSPGCNIIPRAAELSGRVLYDFDLMENGGHIKGFAVEGDNAERLLEAISSYECGNALPYAIGDGNHSLAAAKLHYENLKKELGEKAVNHPARYALCEIVSIGDAAIGFEPIYRVLTECDTEKVMEALMPLVTDGNELTVTDENGNYSFSFREHTHPLTVGTLQNFIDSYLTDNKSVKCDYIHGLNDAESIGRKPGCVAFTFEGIGRDELLPYIEKNGVLPRKTFSMGDALDKRYYLEARIIK